MNAITPTHTRLPDRRQTVSTDMHWNGQTYHLSFGFAETGKIAEIFWSSPKVGSDSAHLISDGAVEISLALQSGLSLQQIAHCMGQVPDPMSKAGHKPASLLGAVLQCARQIEGEIWGRASDQALG